MKGLFMPLFLLLLASCKSQPPAAYYLLTGTYTSGKSEGIYVYRFNPADASTTLVSKATGIRNPSFLAVSPDNRFVYSVEELHGDANGGKLTAFTFNNENGTLTRLNQQPSGGEDPCYVTVDKSGHWLIAGNYSSGTLSVLPIRPNGSLGEPAVTISHEGQGPNKERQERPHVHSTVLSHDNRFLMVPDLGIDKVMIYRFDATQGKLEAASQPSASTAPGSGPRHFDFHPNGKYAYLMEEMSGHVTAFKFDSATGGLQTIQKISAIPPGYTGPLGSADIHVSSDGRFVYASNRGESNTIAVFAVDASSGKLSLVEYQPTLGKIPRNFSLDPTGRYLLVANQNSDEVVIFKRDPQTGRLTDSGKRIAVPNPVCLKWIPVK